MVINKLKYGYYPLVGGATGGLSLLWAHLFSYCYEAGKNALCDYLMWAASLLIPTIFVMGAVKLVLWLLYKFSSKVKDSHIPKLSFFTCFTCASLFAICYCLSQVKEANDSLFIQGYLTIFGIISAINITLTIKRPSFKNDNDK